MELLSFAQQIEPFKMLFSVKLLQGYMFDWEVGKKEKKGRTKTQEKAKFEYFFMFVKKTTWRW